MDFNQKDLTAALDAMRNYASGIPSDLSRVTDPAQLQRIIGLKFRNDIEKDTGRIRGDITPDMLLDEEAELTDAPARIKLARTLRSSQPSLSGHKAMQIEALTYAQLVSLNKSGELGDRDFSFLDLNGVISKEENELIQEFAKGHELGAAPDVGAAYSRATEIIAQRAKNELDAQNAQNDQKSIEAGLKELGFEIDGPDSVQDALANLMLGGNVGLQSTGRSAEYAKAHHGGPGIRNQYGAIYDRDSNVIKDPAMAREVVGEALKGRNIDFQNMLSSGDPAQIAHAKALAHAIDPNAGLTVNGVLDDKAVDVAQAHMNTIGTAVPATYLSTDGASINYAAVSRAAELGTLQMIPEEYLSAEERADLDLFGGMDSAEGQQYIASLISDKGASWYAKGLALNVEQELTIAVPEIVPDAMKLTEGKEYSPEVLESVNVFNQLPDYAADGMPESVEILVGYKRALINAQTEYGNPELGIIPNNDRNLAIVNYESSMKDWENIETEMRADGRWEDVQKYLLDKEPAPAPAAPEDEIRFDTPVAVKGDRLKPHDYVAERISSAHFGPAVTGPQPQPELAQGMDELKKAMLERIAQQQQMTAGLN